MSRMHLFARALKKYGRPVLKLVDAEGQITMHNAQPEASNKSHKYK